MTNIARMKIVPVGLKCSSAGPGSVDEVVGLDGSGIVTRIVPFLVAPWVNDASERWAPRAVFRTVGAPRRDQGPY